MEQNKTQEVSQVAFELYLEGCEIKERHCSKGSWVLSKESSKMEDLMVKDFRAGMQKTSGNSRRVQWRNEFSLTGLKLREKRGGPDKYRKIHEF